MNPYILPGIKTQPKPISYYLEAAGINIYLLRVKTRKREITDTRQAVMAFARQDLKLSTIETGKLVNQDHATAIHALRLVNNEIEITRKYPNMRKTKRLEVYLELVKIKNLESKK